MLRKLIKYDMKSLNRFLPVIHIFKLFFSILVRIFITGRITSQTSNEQINFFLILSFTLYSIIIVALSTGTHLIAGIRFYKNIFTDEGYLTRTLPVTSGTHLLSKVITGSCWAIINMLSMYLCVYIVMWTPYIKSIAAENKDDILVEFGFVGKYAHISLSAALMILLLFSCIGVIGSIIMIYASVALGQLFSSHRVLGAVVTYFVISTLISILSVVVMVIFGHETRLFMTSSLLESDFNFVSYMTELMKITVVFEIVISAILYSITHFIMSKKVNLV